MSSQPAQSLESLHDCAVTHSLRLRPVTEENVHISRADGDSMGPSALDGKNGVACGSVRKPPPRPLAALRASPLATPTIRAC